MGESPHIGLSNWGRWGPADEQGSLNLITPAMIVRAASLIKTGKAYSLAVPLEANGPQWPPRPKTWKVTHYRNDPGGGGSAGDAVMLHSHSGTHMDALCHAWYGNQLYNGFSVAEHLSSDGSTRAGIDKVPCIVGRGVLLDIAAWKRVDHLAFGEPISAADLDQCAAAQNVAVQPGDILLVRTGWLRVFFQDRALFDSGGPGIDESTLPWLKQHGVVAVGADTYAVEVMREMPPAALPVHPVALRDLGIYLVEALNLEELAADKVVTSLLVIAPWRLTGGTGSPLNPIAIA
jgi:kynurenine formamidase